MIQRQGFDSELYQGNPPENADHYLTFTANWRWDLAMYLSYFQATLFSREGRLGEVEYDARRGGSRLDKFGATTEKVEPLMIELLENVSR